MRWLGPYNDQGTISEVAAALRNEFRVIRPPYVFRLAYFAHRPYQFATQKGILQITFREIAEFCVDDRIGSWMRTSLGARSYHGQWSELINDVWAIGADEQIGREQQVGAILDVLRRRAQESASHPRRGSIRGQGMPKPADEG